MNATREILWSIPPSYKTAMYVLFAISLCVMAGGFALKFRFILGKHKIRDLFPQQLNWKGFFSTLLLTGKVPRKKEMALIHGMIFWGFVILWIATDLVAIHYDTPFKVFQGPTYIIISFLADLAGMILIFGLILAFYRRYIKRPDYLSATRPLSELWMYLQLFNLVVTGYIIEGLRIHGTGMPIGEKTWAPVGWFLAEQLSLLDWSHQTFSNTYKYSWFYHMACTMVFIASIGWSKFSHIFMAPLSALITPKYRGAILSPMNFEDENAESFGLKSLEDMTPKQRFDTQACVECGRCTQVCPANLADKPLDPKLIVTKIRDFARKTDQSKDQTFWSKENSLFSSSELDACTTCGACMEECPVNIEHVNIIMEAKRYKALTLGDIPPAAATAINNIRNQGNPWGLSSENRFQWADGLDIPIITPEKKVDYLYYVGCAGSYDASNQKVVAATVKLLKKSGVSFAVMGKTEKCNGDPIRRFGDEYSFFEIAIENIANMRQYQFNKVVTHCPHCLHTIGKEYAKFKDGQFETIHHTELLWDLLKSHKLQVEQPIKEDLTFHDPCYLGRHHGEYDAPRKILEATGASIKEMQQNKDKSLCCGMGGGNMWHELPEGKHLALNRLDHIAETKTSKLATACSYCMINFNSSKGQRSATENIHIQDVAEILEKTIS